MPHHPVDMGWRLTLSELTPGVERNSLLAVNKETYEDFCSPELRFL